MGFRLFQVSDTHLAAAQSGFSRNFNAMMGAVDCGAGCGLLVNTGDLSVNGADRIADLRFARQTHEALRIDWRAVAGNHDAGDDPALPAPHQPMNAARRARWLAAFGDLPWGRGWWFVDAPGWRIVGLDSMLFGADLDDAQAQADFLAAAAAERGDRALMVMAHKPLFFDAADEVAPNGMVMSPRARAALLGALGSHPPAIISSGHNHQFLDRTIDAVRHVWAPSTAFICPDWLVARRGEAIVGGLMWTLNADGGYTVAFVGSPDMTAHDIADMPEVYGDHRARARARGLDV